MNDAEFQELQIRGSLVPGMESWPDEYHHWQALRAAVTEARDRVHRAFAEIDVIDADHDLSAEGKARKRQVAAEKAIAGLEASKALVSARAAVKGMHDRWAAKVGMVVREASNIAEATVQAQIRDHVAAMKSGRMAFLEKNATDAMVASAILTAPAFLSGLTDAEMALVKNKVEAHVAPEIAEAKAETAKALSEVEAAWPRAIKKITERGGLGKARLAEAA